MAVLGDVPLSHFMLPGDVLQMKFACSLGTQVANNVINYRVDSVTGGTITDQQCIDAIDLAAAPLYKAWMPTNATYLGSRGQVIKPTLELSYVTTANAGPGVAVTESLPPQVAFLLSPRTLTPGRVGRGRTYLPFWSEGFNDASSLPTAGAVTAATNWSTGIFANQTVVSGGNNVVLVPVIVSRKAGFTARLVTHVVIRTKWATQRRRSLINKSDVIGP